MSEPKVINVGKSSNATLKFISLDDIGWPKRYRDDLGDIELLAESIKEKGVLQPITVMPTANPDIHAKYTLLAGERRVTAAKMAALTKVPALVRESGDELDSREIELMENAFRKGFNWPEECALIQEIDRLYKDKYSGTADPWSGRKTAQLLNRGVASVSRALQLAQTLEVLPELATIKTADEALKVVKKMEEEIVTKELRSRQENITHKGVRDVLGIADANYAIGDVFLEMAELRTGGMIDLIECDPPYGIDLGDVKAGKDDESNIVHDYQEVTQEDYPEFLLKLTNELYRIAAPNAWLIFWYGPTWHQLVYEALMSAGWAVDVIPAIWAKPNGQTLQPEVNLARAYEPFFVCRKGQPVLHKRGHLNVFSHAPETKKYHPTQRPITLMVDILNTFGVAGQTCFVPFLGSGATLRACYLSGMRGFGTDLNDKYKDKFMLAVEEDTKNLDKLIEAS